MPSSTTLSLPDPLGRVARLARIGLWVSTLVLLLALAVLIFMFSQVLIGAPEMTESLTEGLEIEEWALTLTQPQLFVEALLWASVDILGILMLWQVRQLFHGFLHSGVFTALSALRLRRIGMIVFCMGPVSILSGMLADMLISLWQSGKSVHGAVTIDDSDLYAIVIGLVITAVSHIMLEAARLNEENQAFV